MYFPPEMTAERRWMVRPVRDGRQKQPFSAHETRPVDYEPPAGHDDPNTSYWRWRWSCPAVWASYEQALSYWQRHPNQVEGLSFVLHPAGDKSAKRRLICFDFDDAFSPYGVLDPNVEALLDVLGTFSEYSRSRSGLHVFLYVDDCIPFVNILQEPFGLCKVDVLCSAQVAVTGDIFGPENSVSTHPIADLPTR